MPRPGNDALSTLRSMSDPQSTNPLDEEVYGDSAGDSSAEAVENGNPARPQSELGPIGDQADTEATRVAEQGD